MIAFRADSDTEYLMIGMSGTSGTKLFRLLTMAVADYYDIPSGMPESDKPDGFGDFPVDVDQFRHLVETSFLTPEKLFRQWARFAAGMYENIQNEQYQWFWPTQPRTDTLLHIDNMTRGRPAKVSGVTIGTPAQGTPLRDFTFRTAAGKSIADMDYRRAKAFIKLSHAIAQHLNINLGLVPTEHQECKVEEQAFCRLTEIVVSRSQEWLLSWAEYAAGMYEVIKGEWYAWIWDVSHLQGESFCPVRQPELSPFQPSRKIIAYHGWEFWQKRHAKQREV